MHCSKDFLRVIHGEAFCDKPQAPLTAVSKGLNVCHPIVCLRASYLEMISFQLLDHLWHHMLYLLFSSVNEPSSSVYYHYCCVGCEQTFAFRLCQITLNVHEKYGHTQPKGGEQSLCQRFALPQGLHSSHCLFKNSQKKKTKSCKRPPAAPKTLCVHDIPVFKTPWQINYTDDFAIFQRLNGVGKNSNLPEGKTTLQQKKCLSPQKHDIKLGQRVGVFQIKGSLGFIFWVDRYQQYIQYVWGTLW